MCYCFTTDINCYADYELIYTGQSAGAIDSWQKWCHSIG